MPVSWQRGPAVGGESFEEDQAELSGLSGELGGIGAPRSHPLFPKPDHPFLSDASQQNGCCGAEETHRARDPTGQGVR